MKLLVSIGYVGFLTLAGNAWADDVSDLRALLDANTYDIKLESGELSGSGANLIFDAANGTQFVALGEEHYSYYIPDITTALFRELNSQYDYQYFMTEQDPAMMETFSRAPVRGDQKAINMRAQSYQSGLTFNSDEELRMLAEIGQISSAKGDVIWGCDQAAGVTHVLDLLLETDINESAKSAVRSFREISAEKEAVRDYSKGNYMFDVATEDLQKLRADVGAEDGSHAAWLLDTIIQSSKIFGFYRNGDAGILPGYYENNRYREEHLKDLCLAKYRAAEIEDRQPKVLMKFGSWHLYEGLSPTRMHTIGDFFSNVARFNGNEFLSIHFTSLPKDPEGSMENLGFIWPFIRDLNPDEFAVLDLRPFRRYPNRNLAERVLGEEWAGNYKESYIRLIYGYDLIFFVGTTRGATFEVVPPPK